MSTPANDGSANPPPKKPVGLASPHLSSMALPEGRHQTFEELYGPPENILEIEVLAAPRALPWAIHLTSDAM